MISIFCVQLSSRLQYILDFIGSELFEQPIRVYTDKTEFIQCASAKINYSDHSFEAQIFHIKPVGLLFETGTKANVPVVTAFENTKALYPTDGHFPFDIFAASFYLLTRYEEYQVHQKDEFGRYAHTNSMAFREGFLNLPLINLWLASFKTELAAAFPELTFRHQQFACNITYDIDMAYSYRHKGPVRTIAGFTRSVLAGKWDEFAYRWSVLRGHKQDPFDCFEWLDALHLYCRLKPYYFFLVAKKQIGYDKNISTNKKPFRDLVEYYASKYEAGIHPSWQSVDQPKLLKEEIEWLEVVADKPILSSRQHYIRFQTPETFRNLLEAGIRNEFSMGYGSVNGFRASVCSSFKWYDLERDEPTQLLMHPFCFMDANAFYEQKQTPQETYLELTGYYNTVKRVNGTFTGIWHNHMLSYEPALKGWRDMFELFMKETVYWDAYSDATNMTSNVTNRDVQS